MNTGMGWRLLAVGSLLAVSATGCASDRPEVDREPHFGEPPRTYTVEDLPVPPEAFVGDVRSVTRSYDEWEVEAVVRAPVRRTFTMVEDFFDRIGLVRRYHRPPIVGDYNAADFNITFTVDQSRGPTTTVLYVLTPIAIEFRQDF